MWYVSTEAISWRFLGRDAISERSRQGLATVIIPSVNYWWRNFFADEAAISTGGRE